MGLAGRLTNFKISGSTGWPYDVTGGYIGQTSYVFPDDLVSNTTKLHQEIFSQKDYKPSETVQAINDAIISDLNGNVSDQQPIDTNGDANADNGNTDQNTGANGSGDNSGNGNNSGGNSGGNGNGLSLIHICIWSTRMRSPC